MSLTLLGNGVRFCLLLLNYHSAYFYNLDLGYASPEYTPTGRGFESFYGYLQGQIDYYNKTVVGGNVQQGGLDFWDASKSKNKEYRHVSREAIGTYSLDQYESRAHDLIIRYNATHYTAAQRKDHPFFLYYAHQSVHIPIEARKSEGSRCKNAGPARQTYCSMMLELDDAGVVTDRDRLRTVVGICGVEDE